MKNIAFYSFAGTFVPTLAALAIKKPKDFVINWYIRIPDLSAELIDSVIAIKQMGFDLPTIKNPYGNFKNFLAQKKLESFYMPFSEKKYELEKINFKYVGKNWVDEIIKDKNDTLILPSIRVESFSLLRKISRKMPIFLHEYGNSIKNFSAFDIHPERHDLLTAIFSPGTKYSQQARRANINSKVIITGSSKLDFYSWKEIVKPPTKNPFFVYCNTVGHTQISSSGISQPKKWVPILEKSLKKLGYELVIKLHPHSYFLYRDEAWSNYVYCSPFSADLFKQASGIIADPSSILLEALTLNKPVFLTKNFENVSTYYDFLKQKIPILDYNTDFNSQIIRKYTVKKATTRKKKIWLDKWWYRLDGRSSERIWSNISKMI